MVLASPPLSLEQARVALADEWTRRDPRSPAEIAAFYREAEGLGADLDAWHQTEERRTWTEQLVYVARSIGAAAAVDIGCGAGHDLRALREAGLSVVGVEPNGELAAALRDDGLRIVSNVAQAPIEDAALLVCVDVLEHVADPESFLAGIAARARPNCVLFETTATFDCGTPLHLPENRGWHPGRVLETHGWQVIDRGERVRVWQRLAPVGTASAGLLICAYRGLTVQTHEAVLSLLGRDGWRRHPVKHGDALISRSRSIAVSRWWAETNDDVFLMIDDDILFDPDEAESVVALAREKRGIACAAYPVRNGGHLAIRGLGAPIHFGPNLPPLELRYAATGFMACHRDVIDALVPTMPLCHGNQPWAFWPLFLPLVIEDAPSGGHNYLSEDWAFSERARQAGFTVWLDPTVKLGHLAVVPINVSNMSLVYGALQHG